MPDVMLELPGFDRIKDFSVLEEFERQLVFFLDRGAYVFFDDGRPVLLSCLVGIGSRSGTQRVRPTAKRVRSIRSDLRVNRTAQQLHRWGFIRAARVGGRLRGMSGSLQSLRA